MSDASDPRHANPDPAKRHQAAEVASGSPPMGSKPPPAAPPLAPRREACHLCAGSLIVNHGDGGYGPCPTCDGGRPLEEAAVPPRPTPRMATPAEHLRAGGGPARSIATMMTTRRVAVDVEIEVAVWADDDSAPAAVQILGAMQRARVWLSEAISRLPRPVGGGAGKDGAYSVRTMEVVNDDPCAPVHAEVADAANYLLARAQAALRDAADALSAEARAKRATLHADVFGDKLPARYEEIAARCRALVADTQAPAPALDEGPPPPAVIDGAPARHDLRWTWNDRVATGCGITAYDLEIRDGGVCGAERGDGCDQGGGVMSTTPRLSAISRLSNCLSKLHGERCRRDPRADKLEAFQNELERAALAVIGLDRSGLLPTCGACHGSGRRDLTPTESMTLASVPGEWVTTTTVPGDNIATTHAPPKDVMAIPMWAPNEGKWFWFDDDAYQQRRHALVQCPPPIAGRARAILQASPGEGLADAATRQMTELKANRKLRLAAEERALRAEERAAGALRDVDIWKRDATAQRERLAAAERAADEAGLELANRRRDWHEDRSRMLGILAELVPNVLVRADTESLTDIAHVVVGELGPVDRDAAVRWRHFRDLFEQIGTWSLATFGPGPRVEAILDHVAKEARECRAKPEDAEEWIDLAMLAMDGARRAAGIGTATQWLRALDDKHQKNQARTWPDWRTQDPRKAIEHDRAGEPPPASADDEALADCRLELTRLRDACLHDARRITDVIDVLIARAMREGQP